MNVADVPDLVARIELATEARLGAVESRLDRMEARRALALSAAATPEAGE